MFFISGILLSLIPAALLAQEPDDIQQGQGSATVTAGKAQFQQTCGFCHGPDARGASGPDLLRSPLVNRDVNGNLIGPVIRNGRPEKGMPAFQLPDADISNIVQFLHAEAKTAASVAQRIPREYPLEKLLVGNAEQGKTYFYGAGKCSSCHSVTGDLAHIASKYKPFDLQTRIAFPSGAKPVVTVEDSSGKRIEGEQVYADEFTVTLRDKNGWTHTWKRNSVQVKIRDPLAEHESLLHTYTDQNIHDLFAYLETLK
ncbi:MAG: c-type cytochrome [Acidobacteriaceae bacterium]|nr:c-type cytochrome [Acidobacteriaceae bacterium]